MVPVGSRELIPQLDPLESNRAASSLPRRRNLSHLILPQYFLATPPASPHPLNSLSEDKEDQEEEFPKADAILSRSGRANSRRNLSWPHLDRGIGEAYVSPQIEASLGFSQEEWLEDPIRWYQQIHPDDNSAGALRRPQMFLSGSRCALLTRDRTRWQGGLVSLRSQDDPQEKAAAHGSSRHWL